MKCLDSTFLIDLLRKDKSATELAREMDEEGQMATTEINVFEIAAGIHQSKVTKKTKRLVQAESLFNRLEIFPLDHESALKAAKIMGELKTKGSFIDTLDALVAGIALSHGCEIVVTRNIRHFDRIRGLKVQGY